MNCKEFFGVEIVEELENHSALILRSGETAVVVDQMGLAWNAGEYEEIGGNAWEQWLLRWQITKG